MSSAAQGKMLTAKTRSMNDGPNSFPEVIMGSDSSIAYDLCLALALRVVQSKVQSGWLSATSMSKLVVLVLWKLFVLHSIVSLDFRSRRVTNLEVASPVLVRKTNLIPGYTCTTCTKIKRQVELLVASFRASCQQWLLDVRLLEHNW